MTLGRFWKKKKFERLFKVTKADFISQFIQRDLFSVSALDNLQWRIKGIKLTKETAKAYLESVSGRAALLPLLQNGKLQSFFPSPIVISTVDDFINEITKVNVYNAIFK